MKKRIERERERERRKKGQREKKERKEKERGGRTVGELDGALKRLNSYEIVNLKPITHEVRRKIINKYRNKHTNIKFSQHNKI